ncbi:glycosyl hydrolase family 28 [Curtobacterium sp. PhB130]|uniref:glycoside hydrolase family 28 protein n=1 Tax=unclassified Curtobacterium TaxID=257496 RepID=UPI000F4B29EC|nr:MULTISPECIES: glycosyl hydrolase family 28 protein [unclassified Curtobacterium]ROS71849.1 glycosyl hydrolase family 28 [Curtobacterium sp. PhB130]TCK58243.1 glycosyl hydrolase family 28 [Curtobacterium sp. PhB136]
MTTVSIRDHGAVGDGVTNDAPAIQAAIDACSAAGGGRVLVPSDGVFLTGSIMLKDHVELHLERGSVLDGSADPADYTERFTVSALSGGELRDGTDDAFILIGARDARDIAITGSGTVRGGGRHFITGDTGYIYECPNARPFTVFLIRCEDVTLRDTTFTDAGLWCIRLTGVDRALITGIRVDTDLKYPNADGIDIDRCRQVRISDCEISSGDDGISLKTCEEFPDLGPTEDIVITNCTIRSTSSAIVVGVDAVEPIRNVVVSNCVIRSSHRGLAVNLGQRGDFENILFSGCVVETRHFDDAWWGHGEPIYVSAFPWHNEVGRMRNVRFRNILARSENGVYVAAESVGLIEGVVLDGVRVELDRWSHWPGGEYDRRPYDRGQEIYQHPTSGFHIDTATDVTLRNCEVVWGSRPENFAHAVEAIDVSGLTIEGFRGAAAHPEDLDAIVERTRATADARR